MYIVILDAGETSRIRTEDLLTDLNVIAEDIYDFDNAEEALKFIDDEGANLVFSSLELADIYGISFTDILLHKYPKSVPNALFTNRFKKSISSISFHVKSIKLMPCNQNFKRIDGLGIRQPSNQSSCFLGLHSNIAWHIFTIVFLFNISRILKIYLFPSLLFTQ